MSKKLLNNNLTNPDSNISLQTVDNTLPYSGVATTQEIETNSADTEAILRTLVSMPTVSDSFEVNHEALDYVEKFLKDHGMYTKRYPRTAKMYEGLVASTRPNNAKTPVVLLAAHMDVIPAAKHLFTLRQKGNKYFGRGVYDMKCAIASYMSIVNELHDSLAKYDFAIMIVTDEEIGGRDGVNSTTEFLRLGYTPKFVILPDGGEDWQLEIASNGYLHYTLQAHGITGHSSRPWLGENATEKLIDSIHELRNYFRDQHRASDTLNIAAIKTSDVPANQIPDYATVDFSIRLHHRESIDKWRDLISKICKKHGVESIERAGWDLVFNDLDNPFVRRYADLTEQVTGVKVTGFHSYAGSDARFLAEAGIPYANAYPKGGGHHSENEWLAVEALGQFRRIVRLYLESVARQ